MQHIVRYLTHPQVQIDPAKNVPEWSLNDVGRRRVEALADSGALSGTALVVSSAETKAIETADPLAKALGCDLRIRENMHENDRSATGYLPPEEFEAVADQFFAHPDQSTRGWETACAAQSRIVGEMRECLREALPGDALFVGHGGVGALLFCHLAGLPISREHDQGPGGCYFEFGGLESQPKSGWRPMEHLTASQPRDPAQS